MRQTDEGRRRRKQGSQRQQSRPTAHAEWAQQGRARVGDGMEVDAEVEVVDGNQRLRPMERLRCQAEDSPVREGSGLWNWEAARVRWGRSRVLVLVGAQRCKMQGEEMDANNVTKGKCKDE